MTTNFDKFYRNFESVSVIFRCVSTSISTHRSNQRLNISDDVKLLFFAQSLGFPVIRHFHAPREKQKQATFLEFQSILENAVASAKTCFFIETTHGQSIGIVGHNFLRI